MVSINNIPEFAKFAVAGTAGFLVDAGLVAVLNQKYGISPIFSQCIAFAVAVIITWLFNRHWTFLRHADKKWLREFGKYLAANSVGAAVNNGVYIVLTLAVTTFANFPELAVAVGSLTGMFFNYFSSKFLIFRSMHTEQVHDKG